MFEMHESVTTSVNQFFRIHPRARFRGSMPTLDPAEGVSMRSKGPTCQLVAIFNRHPSESHHCLGIDRVAPPDTNEEDVLEMTGGERGNKGRRAGKAPFPCLRPSPPEVKDILAVKGGK